MDDLRRKAQEMLESEDLNLDFMSSEEVAKLIEELRIHQIELRLQNEELRHIQGNLEDQRLKYVDLYDFAPLGYMTLDKAGVIQDINLFAARLLGESRGDLIGRSFGSFMETSSADALYLHIRSVLANRTLESIELVLSSGETSLPVELTSNLLERGESEDEPCCRTIITSLAQRKIMENQRDKVAKLESLGILAGGLAHDFNNLLMALFGNVSLAKMDLPRNSKAYERLVQTEQVLERARDLSMQLLTFAKGGRPVKKLVSLGKILGDSTLFGTSGLSIKPELAIPRDLWHAELDAGQISQVVHNLVINAVEAMPRGGDLKVEAKNILLTEGGPDGLAPGRYIKFTISDTGTGIEEKTLPKIFDPYFSTKETGSGLGLASSHSVISKHGGRIQVSTTPGVGTSFKVFLPASVEMAQEEVGPEVVVQAEQASLKILLLEDEEEVRLVCLQMLEVLGHIAEGVSTGEAAVELYRKSRAEKAPFDLLLFDLTIKGGMGGVEAFETIREEFPDVRAIISSGYSNDPVMAESEKYGFKGVVKKPYSLKDLQKIIHKVVN